MGTPLLPPSRLSSSLAIVCLVLGLLLVAAGQRIKALDAALAARPATEDHVESKISTTQARGKIIVVRHYVPGACPPIQVSAVPHENSAPVASAPILVDETIEEDPVVTTVVKERDSEKTSTPISTPPPKWRYAGVLADPFAPAKLVGLRGGITLYDRVDLGLGVRFWPRTETQAEVSLRF